MERQTKNTSIPIVFASNDHYAPYLGVAIFSLIFNGNINRNYNIYILYTNISKSHIAKIKSMETKNVKINFINVSEFVESLPLYSVQHYSVEMFYRIIIPDILTDYKKVIYLDCDLIILKDIAELYDIDIKEYILGASINLYPKYLRDYIGERLHLSPINYFNSGVLLINTDNFKKYQIKEKCFAVLANKNDLSYPDQDILNIVCNDLVKYLPLNWNFPWQHNEYVDEPTHHESLMEECLTIYLEAANSINILHFTSSFKPWNAPHREMAEVFWQYARKSIFYEEIIYTNTKNPLPKKSPFEETYLFPFNKVKKDELVILFGAGKVGQVFYDQIELTKYCKVILWVDNNYKNKKTINHIISPPEVIDKVNYDKILIAVASEKLANEIIIQLKNLNIEEDKLIWCIPNS